MDQQLTLCSSAAECADSIPDPELRSHMLQAKKKKARTKKLKSSPIKSSPEKRHETLKKQKKLNFLSSYSAKDA